MKKSNNSIWGIALIVLGVMFLVNQVMPWMSDLMWVAGFAIAGAAFLFSYQKNKRNWGLLIPAYAMFAIALLIFLDMFPWLSAITEVYVMFAIALPFFFVYYRNRKNWWALIPGGIMASIGVGLLIDSMSALFAAGLILVGAFLLVRQFAGTRKNTPAVPRPTSGPEADRPMMDFEPLGTKEPVSGPEADHA